MSRVEYKVVYSKRKTISLCIKDGGLVVKAPFGTKRARIEGIVSSHIDWVDKNIKKQTERNEKYAGVYVWNLRECKERLGTKTNRKVKPAEEVIRIEGGMPQIIDR